MGANADLIRRWFDEVWCRHDEAAIDELMAADAELHGLYGEGPGDREAFKQVWRHNVTSYRDFAIEIDHVVETDDAVAAHTRGQATLKDGSGPVRFTGTLIVKVRDGRLAEGWESWNLTSLLAAHGLLSERDAQQVLLGH